MCIGCWQEYGSPIIISDAILTAAALAGAVLSVRPSGGNLHVQLEDWNLEDEYFEEDEMPVYSQPSIPAECACYAAFKELPLIQRASALAKARGYWS